MSLASQLNISPGWPARILSNMTVVEGNPGNSLCSLFFDSTQPAKIRLSELPGVSAIPPLGTSVMCGVPWFSLPCSQQFILVSPVSRKALKRPGVLFPKPWLLSRRSDPSGPQCAHCRFQRPAVSAALQAKALADKYGSSRPSSDHDRIHRVARPDRTQFRAQNERRQHFPAFRKYRQEDYCSEFLRDLVRALPRRNAGAKPIL
jgi:hypothetical protein